MPPAHGPGRTEPPGLRRVLGVVDLTLLGVGAIVGTGIFVLSGHVAARHTGPAVVLAFALAAAAAMVAGATYAELARHAPGPGGAYGFARRLLGEALGAQVGCTLLVGYALAAASVAAGWSGYLGSLVDGLGLPWLTAAWRRAPWAWDAARAGWAPTGGRLDLPAAAVILGLTALLARGVEASARANAVGVVVKVLVVVVFVVGAAPHVSADNLRPFLPANRGTFGELGPSGLVRGVSLLFFAYNGFDAIATAAGEARLPGRDLPRAMLGALVAAATLYVACAATLVGVVPSARLGVADPISVALSAAGLARLGPWLQAGCLVGLVSVMLVNLLGVGRVAMAMAADGHLPAALAELSARHRSPARATWLGGAAAAALAALVPLGLLGELMCVGTLWVFAVVGWAAVARRRGLAPRGGRGRGSALLSVPGLSVLVAAALLATASPHALVALAAWLAALNVALGLARRRGAAPPRPRAGRRAAGSR